MASTSSSSSSSFCDTTLTHTPPGSRTDDEKQRVAKIKQYEAETITLKERNRASERGESIATSVRSHLDYAFQFAATIGRSSHDRGGTPTRARRRATLPSYAGEVDLEGDLLVEKNTVMVRLRRKEVGTETRKSMNSDNSGRNVRNLATTSCTAGPPMSRDAQDKDKKWSSTHRDCAPAALRRRLELHQLLLTPARDPDAGQPLKTPSDFNGKTQGGKQIRSRSLSAFSTRGRNDSKGYMDAAKPKLALRSYDWTLISTPAGTAVGKKAVVKELYDHKDVNRRGLSGAQGGNERGVQRVWCSALDGGAREAGAEFREE
ncbi:hypothetical protein C8R44DRAFT_744225 [Mycena epipterygia]|nr:hypothetical protein C8R44DRAFT_744225 [Mycena epipterygia]